MCKWGDTIRVRLKDSYCDVDACIAPIVEALNNNGIETVASCCGHGHINGNIILGDNRVLEIHPDFDVWIKEQHIKNKVNIHGEPRNIEKD